MNWIFIIIFAAVIAFIAVNMYIGHREICRILDVNREAMAQLKRNYHNDLVTRCYNLPSAVDGFTMYIDECAGRGWFMRPNVFDDLWLRSHRELAQQPTKPIKRKLPL